MAWDSAAGVNLGNATSTAASTTLVLTTTAEVLAGKVIVVGIAVNNIATVDGDQGDVVSVTDSAGNTYTKARQRTNAQTGAGTGACGAIYFSKLGTTLPSAGTITVTFNGSPVAKAMQARSFGIGAGNVVTVEGGANGTPEDGTTVPVATISGLTSQEYLWVAVVAAEGPSGDTYTEDADYAVARAGTTGGGAATNMTMNRGFRVFTGTTDTHAPTLGTARDLAHVFVALKEAAAAGALLEGSIGMIATLVGVLTTAITMAGAAVANLAAAAVLTTQITLGGAVAGQMAPAASLTTEIQMAGAVVVQLTPSGDLTAPQQALLEGQIAGTLSGAGALTTEIRLAGTAAGGATLAGDLLTSIQLAGVASGTLQAAGDLMTAIPLGGSVAGQLVGVGVLETAIPLAGQATGQLTPTGDLTAGGIPFQGFGIAESAGKTAVTGPGGKTAVTGPSGRSSTET